MSISLSLSLTYRHAHKHAHTHAHACTHTHTHTCTHMHTHTHTHLHATNQHHTSPIQITTNTHHTSAIHPWAMQHPHHHPQLVHTLTPTPTPTHQTDRIVVKLHKLRGSDVATALHPTLQTGRGSVHKELHLTAKTTEGSYSPPPDTANRERVHS